MHIDSQVYVDYLVLKIPLVIGMMTTCMGATGGGRTRPEPQQQTYSSHK